MVIFKSLLYVFFYYPQVIEIAKLMKAYINQVVKL